MSYYTHVIMLFTHVTDAIVYYINDETARRLLYYSVAFIVLLIITIIVIYNIYTVHLNAVYIYI